MFWVSRDDELVFSNFFLDQDDYDSIVWSFYSQTYYTTTQYMLILYKKEQS
jgi:hypothetical protein